MQAKQQGFTLIEITIVLVIIGLLIGGITKGQELVNNARVKNLSNDFRNIPVYIYGYQDKFRALPGDDKAATTHVAASADGDGDGIIEGHWNDAAASGSESIMFWQNIRLAQLAAGSTSPDDNNYIPTNALGGVIGIQSGTSELDSTPIKSSEEDDAQALSGSYIVCSANIPGKLVRQLDLSLDDGNSNSGSMMAGSSTDVGTPMVAAAELSNDSIYTVCLGV